ncbi:MAG: sulfate ABC transporter permease subunit CysW [Helicobacteraceae bacterium]|jgi:sulfate transport system permease protein|nr:sulfate ABC transporter permease subunit CysW [Helicobacteraceae bacterium]
MRKEPGWLKYALIGVSLLFLAIFIALPLFTIFQQAFSRGWETYRDSILDTETFEAIKLSVLIAAIVVPLNAFFGVMAAWAIAKFDFFGKNVLITLIELPFSVSPIIAGLIYVLLFGANGWFGEWLMENEIRIVFALPGMVMATAFVTFPFVARELIPLMQELGRDDEEAALTLGAGGLYTFWRVTLPNIKWGLLYGVILTNARAMGEFGAVAVVSGLQRGMTITMPLQIEILYNEYHLTAAFAVASILTFLALLTLAVKSVIERFITLQRKEIVFKEAK